MLAVKIIFRTFFSSKIFVLYILLFHDAHFNKIHILDVMIGIS